METNIQPTYKRVTGCDSGPWISIDAYNSTSYFFPMATDLRDGNAS